MNTLNTHAETAPWLMIPDVVNSESNGVTEIQLAWTSEEVNKILSRTEEETGGNITYTVISLSRAKAAPKLLMLVVKMFSELKYQYRNSGKESGLVMKGFQEDIDEIVKEITGEVPEHTNS